MVLLISGTNRQNSLTEKFAAIYYALLLRKAADAKYLNLTALPDELLHPSPDFYEQKPTSVLAVQHKYFEPAQKLVFIVPEYNGSFPGILKLLIDGMEPKLAFRGKKAALIGIATGRAGNLRGLDHLSAVLIHMGVIVLPNLLPISRVQDEILENRTYRVATMLSITRHIDDLLAF